MKKLTLFLVLLILFLGFFVFFYKIYINQKTKGVATNNLVSSPTSLDSGIVEIPSKYLPYSKEAFDKSLLDKRPIVLFFTANWCVECQNQDLVNKNVFESLNKEGVTGFAIHILDSETTTSTDSLAKKFDVKKENTIVILNGLGAVYFKNVGNINFDELKSKILEAR